jgi:hypothetical protein
MRVPLARCRMPVLATLGRPVTGDDRLGGGPPAAGLRRAAYRQPFTAMPSVPPTVSILAYLPLAVGVAAGGIAIAIGKQCQAVLGYVTYRLLTVF